jgi:hypothetical protein
MKALAGIFCDFSSISTMVKASFGHITTFSSSLHHTSFSNWAYKLVFAFPPPYALFYFGNIFTFFVCLHHLWAYSAPNKFSPPYGWAYMKYLLRLHHGTWWSANTFRLICPNPEVLENKYGGGYMKNPLYAQIRKLLENKHRASTKDFYLYFKKRRPLSRSPTRKFIITNRE